MVLVSLVQPERVLRSRAEFVQPNRGHDIHCRGDLRASQAVYDAYGFDSSTLRDRMDCE